MVTRFVSSYYMVYMGGVTMTKLTKNVMLMGNGHFNYYIIGSENAALVECGTTAGAYFFTREWFLLQEKPKIKYIVLLHSHFDHVCGIVALKELFPDAVVVASKETQQLLTKEKIVRTLFKSDQHVMQAYLSSGLIREEYSFPVPDKIIVDMTVGEGDRLEIDNGLNVRFLEAVGHSPCSIAAYLEEDQVMLTSDAAGGFLGDQEVAPVFYQDYKLYINTIKKFMAFPTNIVGPGHGKVPQGREAIGFYWQALESAEKCYNWIKADLTNGKDEDQLTSELFAKYITDFLTYYPEDLMNNVMRLLIKRVKVQENIS
jgi:glyoxylase-like metal-dependent hydrolase (beta-lactamase superfamily II)